MKYQGLRFPDAFPAHLRPGMAAYFKEGVLPGSFLVAVLENNLYQAFACADEVSKAGLEDVVRWCYMNLPSVAWGNEDRVMQWVKNGGLDGKPSASSMRGI